MSRSHWPLATLHAPASSMEVRRWKSRFIVSHHYEHLDIKQLSENSGRPEGTILNIGYTRHAIVYPFLCVVERNNGPQVWRLGIESP